MTTNATRMLQGLTADQAASLLVQHGPNELSATKRRTLAAAALGIVREPMSLLLVACGAIYLVLNDLQESLMLLGFVAFIMGITLFQERKTEHALDALRDMASPRALVIRNGRRIRIAGREVVEGDLVVLSEGDRVFADVTILESNHLAVDAQGAIVMATVVAVHAVALHRGQGELDSRTLTFTTFMVANIGLIFTDRSWSGTAFRSKRSVNSALAWLTAAVPVFLALIIYVPGLRNLFRFAPIHAIEIAICVIAGVLSVVWFELFKAISRHRATRRPRRASATSTSPG